MKIAVSTGNSRMEKKWNLKEMELSEFRDRISQTIRTSETMEQYRKMSKAQQDDVKDVGGYVLGRLKGGRRKKDCVLSRSALTLDMDYAHADVADQIEMFQTFGCFIYSTHKHTKEKPRLRLIVPLLREVTPDEYMAVSRKVAEEIGMELFDDTTYEPSRLMYWPSTSADGEFFFKEITGDPLDPDEVLSKYKDWKDVSSWPVSNRQHSIVQKDIKKQEDPLQKRGVIGAFNRTFTITQAIDTFISDVYQPSSMPGRYDYVPADSAAGVVIYDDVFACTIAVGRKIFPLIRKFAGKKDIDNLRMFLEMEVSEHREKFMEFSRRRALEQEGSKQFHFYNVRSREEQVLYKRAKSNLEMLNDKGGRRNEDSSINR